MIFIHNSIRHDIYVSNWILRDKRVLFRPCSKVVESYFNVTSSSSGKFKCCKYEAWVYSFVGEDEL